MASLLPLNRFSQTLQSFRGMLPFHEELPPQITDEETEAMFKRTSGAANAGMMAASMSFREMAVFCRMLTMPVSRLEPVRERWEMLSTALHSKTYYLQLRAQLQFAPTHPVLLAEFTRCAAFIRNTPGAMARVERLLKSTRDDLVRLQPGENAVSHVLMEFEEHRTLLGVYAADQGLMRHAPLFQQFREAWFIQCGPEAYPLDGHELLQALDSATEASVLAMLGRFLQVHTMETFPETLTHQLIARFGEPGEGSIWEGAVEAAVSGRTNTDDGTENQDMAEGLSALRFWHMRQRMKDHFGVRSLKYEILLRFLSSIERISQDAEQEAIFLHFKGFVVIDFKSVEPFSWICDPTELSLRYEEMIKAMREQSGQPSRKKNSGIQDARDFVMEQEGGAAIRLTFVEVGRLYTMDALSIRLGLQEREIWGVM